MRPAYYRRRSTIRPPNVHSKIAAAMGTEAAALVQFIFDPNETEDVGAVKTTSQLGKSARKFRAALTGCREYLRHVLLPEGTLPESRTSTDLARVHGQLHELSSCGRVLRPFGNVVAVARIGIPVEAEAVKRDSPELPYSSHSPVPGKVGPVAHHPTAELLLLLCVAEVRV